MRCSFGYKMSARSGAYINMVDGVSTPLSAGQTFPLDHFFLMKRTPSGAMCGLATGE